MWIKAVLIAFTIVLNPSFSIADESAPPNFANVLAVKEFNFPKDHGASPAYKTEWWYFTGHLETMDKQTFGFELTFFRVGVNPTKNSKSNWEIQSIYLGHFAVTDDANNAFYHTEKISRDNFKMAGSSETNLDVWIGNWSANLAENTIYLKARSEEIALELDLKPFKSVILQGENGLSVKGPEKGQASYYSSFTNLQGTGELKIKNTTQKINKAKVWMDHEVTSSTLAYGVDGWDWFAIQLDDESEIMLYQLRDKDNKATKYSSGTIIYPDNTTKKLSSNEFSITPLASWTSKTTKITYPQNWTLKIPQEKINLEVTPTVKDQEMVTDKSTKNTYWEGRSKVKGQINGKDITGNAYVELVGY